MNAVVGVLRLADLRGDRRGASGSRSFPRSLIIVASGPNKPNNTIRALHQ